MKDVQRLVNNALNNARENEAEVLAGRDVRAIAVDLQQFDAELEDVQLPQLEVAVARWLGANPK